MVTMRPPMLVKVNFWSAHPPPPASGLHEEKMQVLGDITGAADLEHCSNWQRVRRAHTGICLISDLGINEIGEPRIRREPKTDGACAALPST